MNKDRKKELMVAYKERPVIGGVYALCNEKNGKMLLLSTANLQGVKNQFDFAQRTGSLIHMKLQADWKLHGNYSFTLKVLEELDKVSTQTPKEFRNDIKLLEEIWREKLASEKRY